MLALAQPHLALTLPEFYTLSFVAFSLGPAILVTLDKSLSCSTPPPLIGKENTGRLVAVVRTGFASLRIKAQFYERDRNANGPAVLKDLNT